MIDKHMNSGFEAIKNRILDDAQKSASEIAKACKQEISIIDKEIENKIGDELIKISDKYDEIIKDQQQKVLSQNNLQTKIKILETKQKIIDGIFTNVYNELLKLPEAEYRELLSKLIAQSNLNDSQTCQITYLERDVKNMSGGGFIVKNDRIYLNFSFENLLTILKKRYLREVSEILFGEI